MKISKNRENGCPGRFSFSQNGYSQAYAIPPTPFSSSEGKVHGSVGSFRWKDLLNCLCVVTRGIVFLVRFECVTLCRHPLFWPSQNRVLSFWTNHSECLLVGFFHVVFGMCYIPSACVNDMPPPEKGRFVKPSVNMAAASCLYIVCRNDVLQT